ncbi:MAG: AMIN domain-containing protein [Gammaproteobacteria bacterium]|nr:AMIN domain-containing protein [Gammaproteobacteria bacterium]
MQLSGKTFITLVLLFISSSILAGTVVRDARLWAAPESTRIVFDISAPVEHSLFTLKKPNRIVIDVRDATLISNLSGAQYNKGVVKRIRTGKHNKSGIRIVLDLANNVKPKSFLLKPHHNYGHRLVIDLQNVGVKKVSVSKPVKKIKKKSRRDLVIAIDAGHGGEDPGATGHRGTREKDVVMAIARKLQRLISRQRGMRAVMIRKGDYYVGLRKRVKIAQQHKADMFISIHADAFKDKRARGVSVFALSQHGASTETARWLAESENAADFIGGVSLDDKDDLLASVLLDLSMNGKVEASLELGDYVLSELKNANRVHKRKVGQAAFAVLKSPDIPSILVETAFISNPQEERKLLNPKHQLRMARSILRGVKTYFSHNMVPGTLLAQRRHRIVKGENLSLIADQYKVSLKALRTENRLRKNTLRIGDVLLIPEG